MRYVVRPTQYIDEEDPGNDIPYIPSLTVYEDDDIIPTGLLDQHGDEICRYTKNTIGFLSDIADEE